MRKLLVLIVLILFGALVLANSLLTANFVGDTCTIFADCPPNGYDYCCVNQSLCTTCGADTTAPTFTSVPADVTIDCADDSSPASLGTATAIDDCDALVTIDYSDVTDGSCITTGSYVIYRIWTATDDCSNYSEAIQTILVEDTGPPVFTDGPADGTFECDNVPAAAPGSALTATDDCDPALVVGDPSEFATEGACIGDYTLERTWEAVDCSGNISTYTQTLTIVDTEVPVISYDSPIDIDCSADPHPDNIGWPEISDNCSSVLSEFSDATVSGSCAGSILREYTSTDDCGNATTIPQVINLIDDTAPVITCPPDVQLDCSETDFTPGTHGQAIVDDDCDGSPTVTYLDGPLIYACESSYNFSRTWTAQDHCDNSSDCVQTFTVEDNDAPVILSVPNNVTLDCAEPLPTDNITATDNCSSMTIDYRDRVFPGPCDGTYTIDRTHQALDDCGHATYEVQTIFVEDTTPPVITSVPEDGTFDCSQGVPGGSLDFKGYFLPENWDVFTEERDDWVEFFPDNSGVTIAGADDGSEQYAETGIAIIAPYDGYLSFGYYYFTYDGAAQFDVPFLVVGQNQTALVVDEPDPVTEYEGSISVPVQAGDLIVIGIASMDSGWGQAFLDVYNFMYMSSDVGVEDDCSSSAGVRFTDEIMPGSCELEYTVMRTFEAMDSCENLSDPVVQTIECIDFGGCVSGGKSIVDFGELTETGLTITVRRVSDALFDYKGESHYASLIDVDPLAGYAIIEIRSDPLEIQLFMDENTTLDLDGDGWTDANITLVNIDADSAEWLLMPVPEPEAEDIVEPPVLGEEMTPNGDGETPDRENGEKPVTPEIVEPPAEVCTPKWQVTKGECQPDGFLEAVYSDISDCGEPILTKRETCDYAPFVPVEEPGLDLGLIATAIVIVVLGGAVVYAVLNRKKLTKMIKG